MAQIKGFEELVSEAAKSAVRAVEARGGSRKDVRLAKETVTISGINHGTWVGIILPHLPHDPGGPVVAKQPIWIGIIAEQFDPHVFNQVQQQFNAGEIH